MKVQGDLAIVAWHCVCGIVFVALCWWHCVFGIGINVPHAGRGAEAGDKFHDTFRFTQWEKKATGRSIGVGNGNVGRSL